MVKGAALLLCLAFFPLSAFARFWIVQRVKVRPQVLQSNDPLELIGWAALLSLLGGCFLLLNLDGRWRLPALIFLLGIAFDIAVRWYFFEREVYRIRRAARVERPVAVRKVENRCGYKTAGLILTAALWNRLRSGSLPSKSDEAASRPAGL